MSGGGAGPLEWSRPQSRPGETSPGFPVPDYAAAAARPSVPAGPSMAWSPPVELCAGPWVRLAAFAVDVLAVLALLVVTTLLTSLVESRGLHWLYKDPGDGDALVFANGAARPLLVGLPTLTALAYAVVLPGLWRATAGMRLLGVEVVRAGDRRALGIGRALLRVLAWAAGCALLLAAPLSVLFDPQHRGLHDRAAGAAVVRRARG